jgi:hypothetical protein
MNQELKGSHFANIAEVQLFPHIKQELKGRHIADIAEGQLFPQIKQELKGRHFADVAEVQRESLASLDGVPVEGFSKCFQQWEQHWDRCLQSQGEYFEGDSSFRLVQIF